MRIRTRIAKLLLGKEVQLYECWICGRLNTKIATHTWHVRECILVDALKRGIEVPSFRAAMPQ
jgi:hypothetical protein